MKLKLNKGGLKLSAVYAVFSTLMILLSFTVGDPKSRAFLQFFALAPDLLMLNLLRLLNIPDAWMKNGWVFLGLPLLTMYCIGWASSAVAKFLRRLPSSGDEPPKSSNP